MTALGRTVGIIGAGIAGLACARTLAANAFDVKVFDKGRGVGGRTATRRAEPDLAFDHGAQYFTARDARLQKVTADWLSRGVVAEWLGCVVRLENGAVTHTSPQPRYVGVPGMTAMAADLASAIRVQTRTQIVAMSRGPSGWTIKTDAHENFGSFETVVVTLPAPQSAVFLQPHAFGAIASTLQMTPCWAVLVAFESKLEVPWDGAFVHNSPLSWVARNSSKPGRSGQSDCWVLHASPERSVAHLEATPDTAARELLDAFSSAIAERLPPDSHLTAHRWRYSHGSDADDRQMLFDPEVGLAVCGDWLAGGRVEGAFLSGVAAAEAIYDSKGLKLGESGS